MYVLLIRYVFHFSGDGVIQYVLICMQKKKKNPLCCYTNAGASQITIERNADQKNGSTESNSIMTNVVSRGEPTRVWVAHGPTRVLLHGYGQARTRVVTR